MTILNFQPKHNFTQLSLLLFFVKIDSSTGALCSKTQLAPVIGRSSFFGWMGELGGSAVLYAVCFLEAAPAPLTHVITIMYY